MRGLSADARRDLPLAAVAAATTWLTMLSWRGFSDLWGRFLGPLILVAIAVPVAGVILRAAPIPRRLGVLIHVAGHRCPGVADARRLPDPPDLQHPRDRRPHRRCVDERRDLPAPDPDERAEHRPAADPVRRARPARRRHPRLLAAAGPARGAAAARRLLRADQRHRQRRLVGRLPARGRRLPADDVPARVGPHHPLGPPARRHRRRPRTPTASASAPAPARPAPRRSAAWRSCWP